MSINVSAICYIEVTGDEQIQVSLTEDYTKQKPFIFATIERVEDDEPIETFSISDAEQLYTALGEAIQSAKQAVTEAIANLEAA